MMLNNTPAKWGRKIKCYFSIKYLKTCLHLLAVILSDPYWIHASYFVAISLVGLLPLRLSPTKSKRYLNVLDAFYTSVSAATVSSLGAVAMEDLSHFHLVVMIILMLAGGEVFTSSCFLHLARLRLWLRLNRSNPPHHSINSTQMIDFHHYQITSNSGKSIPQFDYDLPVKDQRKKESVVSPNKASIDPEKIVDDDLEYWEIYDPRKKAAVECPKEAIADAENVMDDDLEYEALTYLGYLSIVYFLLVQLAGIVLITIYFSLSTGGESILSDRGVDKFLFAVFTVVSSFANCGFTPLNDNMMPLRKHSVLLMILGFEILLGNTMFGPCFTAILFTLRRFIRDEKRRKIYDYIVKNGCRLFADHLFSTRQNMWLILSAAGFLTIGVVMILGLHWDSEALDGLTTWEKVIGGVFQTVSIRHAGENIVNPQLLSAALLVFYIVLMYLPPYPLYQAGGDVMNIKPPPKAMEESSKHEERQGISVQFEKLVLHDSCYLLVAVILICITERDSLSQDPLNFNVLAIVFEVASAYGNVGISLGYSCILLNKMSNHYCEEVSYSFSGKWSVKGKLIIIMVMFLGRLKGIKSSVRRKLFPCTVPSCHFQFGSKKSNPMQY